MDDKKISFSKMSEIETPPGAEGWEEMYASFHVPGELKEEEDNRLWFRDSIHKPRCVYPFDAWDPETIGMTLGENNSSIFNIPSALGVDTRIVNGYYYSSPSIIDDPKIVAQRMELFQERAGFYFENWLQLVELRKERIYEVNRIIEKMDFSLPNEEEIEKYVHDITSKKKVSPGLRPILNYYQLIEFLYEVWCYHFEFCNIGYSAYMSFYDFCHEHFPDISDVEVSSMTAGVSVEMYKPQEYLIELAELVIKLNLQDTFLRFAGLKREKVNELFSVLEKSKEGKTWLKRLNEIKDPWFNVATGRGYVCTEYTWLDDLSIPIGTIIDYVRRIEEGKSVERPMATVQEKRRSLLDGYGSLLESEHEKQTFYKLHEIALKAYAFIEGHQFYIDSWFHQAMYHALERLGNTIKDFGLIDDSKDLFCLKRGEIADLVFEMMFNYGMGYRVSNGNRWRAKIAKRKKILSVLEAWQPPPALGPVPERVTEPFTRMLWGVTKESLGKWQESMGVASGEEGHILKGFASSPGTVVGKARVVLEVSELGELQEGEILVAPSTEPSWSYVFVKIAGTVTDIGGVMSHAAIVCREYELPAVTGVGVGTRVIKTGQTIEVRGNEGIVKILG